MPRNNIMFKSLQDRPWALHPAKFEEIANFLDRRLAGEKLEIAAVAAKEGNKADDSYEVRNGVAILPVFGVIDKRMNLLMRISGGTSTELLARDFQQALDDPDVTAILLDIESPGGSVDGPKDVADLIYQARGRKPVVAYANGLMASAAYWIGSAADVIVANETAEVGSIGVAAMHYDVSAADALNGVKRTAIFAGKYKRIASDEKPLSEEGKNYLQGIVDDYYGLFLEAVARNRRVDIETVQKNMADGRIFIGKKALKAGLVDKIGNFNDALVLARQKGGDMPKNITKEQLQAENPELYKDILAEGAAGVKPEDVISQDEALAEKLRTEGRVAERERCVKILSKAGLKGISLAVIQEGDDYETALEKFWDNREKVKAETLAALQEEAPPLVGTQPVAVETVTGLAALTAEDKKMAALMGVTEESYLKSKIELASRVKE